MSTQHNQGGLTAQQKQQFHEDGFLFVQNVLPNAALQPLIDELAQQVDEWRSGGGHTGNPRPIGYV